MTLQMRQGHISLWRHLLLLENEHKHQVAMLLLLLLLDGQSLLSGEGVSVEVHEHVEQH